LRHRERPDHKSKLFKYLRHLQRCCDRSIAAELIAPLYREGFKQKAPVPRVSEDAKAGQVPMDHAPGRIGFMSTQRRASRWPRKDSTKRAEMLELSGFSFGARNGRALASGGTAPPNSQLSNGLLLRTSESPARLATNSLLPDHRIAMLARLGIRRCSPPHGAADGSAETAKTATHRSSIPHIPHLPARTRFHRSLPHAPAGRRRWAERHDGKRNLYIQHTA
jgi:hypothetical protein